MSDLELAIERSRSGDATTGDLLAAFLAATVFAPTSVDPSLGAGSFTPLTVTVGNSTALPVFTSLDLLANFGTSAPFAASLEGYFLVRSVRPNTGILVNPGAEAGFEIAPHVVARLADHVASVRAKRQ